MLLIRDARRRSRAFTLVELMVSAALAVTIMWILAESFKMGIDFARSARSTGDMMTQLNNAGQIMMRDLGQTGAFSPSGQPQHFLPPLPPFPQITGAMRNVGQLSMPDTLNALGANITNATPYMPPSGYFHLYSPPPAVAWASFTDDSEGFYIDTINPATVVASGPPPASTGASTGHQLQFTAFLPQGLPQNQFVTTCPPPGNPFSQVYYSRAAEIAYFLGPQVGQTVPQMVVAGMTNPPANAGAMPLYNLYRRQRLVAVMTDYASNLNQPLNRLTSTGQPNTYYDPNATDVISATVMNGQYSANTLAKFGSPYLNNTNGPIPATRVPVTPLTTYGRIGDDIVISNVLSFEVLAAWDPSPTVYQPPYTRQNPSGTIPIPPPRPFPQNSNYPYDYLPALNFNKQYPYTFDTWYALTLPKIPIRNGTIPNPRNWNNFSTAPGNPNLIPMPARINGLQITIRIYDPKTHQARQNTWRVAL